jgi:FtsP/CotA-like multicopper oxidase with cupredoxin domain
MMKHEEQHEVDLSRRKFLKLGGLLGLAFGALSLPSLRWTESATDASRETTQEPWLEAKKKKKSKKTSGKKKSADDGSNTDWHEVG